VTEEIVHRAAGQRIEGEVAILAVAREQPLALERAADPLGNPFDERSELPRARRCDPAKHRRDRDASTVTLASDKKLFATSSGYHAARNLRTAAFAARISG
jgi:hypothetical protein